MDILIVVPVILPLVLQAHQLFLQSPLRFRVDYVIICTEKQANPTAIQVYDLAV